MAMDVLGGDRGFMERAPQPLGPASKLDQAVQEALTLRQNREAQQAVERMQTALNWLGAAGVRRELRVAVPRELGFARLMLGNVAGAREALLMAFEQASHDVALVDPVKAGLATCDLMVGDVHRARQHLEGRGRNRRATLSTLARIHLYEGQTIEAEKCLQEAEQAPGGTTASGVLHPPSALLRCFANVWGGRPDQARMLYDNVADLESPLWALVRVALLRALWVQTGDARYLALSSSTAEQLRYAEEEPELPYFKAAVIAQHGAVYALTGEISMALEAAEESLELLKNLDQQRPPALILPEWPKAAVLADLMLVFREAGREDLWSQAHAQWDSLAWSSWTERMVYVSGPRVKHALQAEREQTHHHDGPSNFEALAVKLLEDPRQARLLALRSISQHAMSLGVEWFDAKGLSLGRLGARPKSPENASELPEGVERLPLPEGEYLYLYKAQPEALRQLDRDALEALARVVSVREHETKRLTELHDQVVAADAAKRLAEERLEQVRRPGTDKGHGGRFPTIVGRGERLRRTIDQLGGLTRTLAHVRFEGLPGSGRRHFAQALFLSRCEDPTGSARAAALELSLLPADQQIEHLERLEKTALSHGETAILNEIPALTPMAFAWLRERLTAPRPQGIRWLICLDSRDDSPTSKLLRSIIPTEIHIPGLDEHLEDLPVLIDHFAREMGKRPDDISTATRAHLARRAFPGQLAELRLAVRAACSRAGSGLVQPEHFDRLTHTQAGDSFGGEDPLALGLREATRLFQRDLVVRALEATAGQLSRAADLLAIPKAQLQKLAKDLEVDLSEEGVS